MVDSSKFYEGRVQKIVNRICSFVNYSGNDPTAATITILTNDWEYFQKRDNREHFIGKSARKGCASPKLTAAYLNIENTVLSTATIVLGLTNICKNMIKDKTKEVDMDESMELFLSGVYPKHEKRTLASAYFHIHPLSGLIDKTFGFLFGMGIALPIYFGYKIKKPKLEGVLENNS